MTYRSLRSYAVLVTDDLPELGTDLVTALTTLDGNDLTHVGKVSKTFFFVDGAKGRQNQG